MERSSRNAKSPDYRGQQASGVAVPRGAAVGRAGYERYHAMVNGASFRTGGKVPSEVEGMLDAAMVAGRSIMEEVETPEMREIRDEQVRLRGLADAAQERYDEASARLRKGLEPFVAEYLRVKTGRVPPNIKDHEKAAVRELAKGLFNPRGPEGALTARVLGRQHFGMQQMARDLASLHREQRAAQAEARAVSEAYREGLQRGVWERLRAIRGKTMGVPKQWFARQIDRQAKMSGIVERVKDRALLAGGYLVESPSTPEDREAMAEAMSRGMQFFDARALSRPGEIILPMEAVGSRGFYIPWLGSELGFPPSIKTVHVVALPRSPDGGFDHNIARHELGHLMDYQDNHQYVHWAFLRRRAAGSDKSKSKPKALNSILGTDRYGKSEKAIEDNFGNPYAGKVYGAGATGISPIPQGLDGTNSELFTMGIEALFDEDMFSHLFDFAGKGDALDVEYLQYVIGLLAILGRKN
jgi:hypothetical protein